MITNARDFIQDAKMNYSPIIAPAVALVIWFLLLTMMIMPAVLRAHFADPPLTAEEQQTILAERARKIQEQPVLFYVVCFALAYIGAGSGLVNGLAWVFAAFWAMHKLPESSSNEYLRCAAGWIANIILCGLAIYTGVRVSYDMLTT